jgi:hypothetical protein
MLMRVENELGESAKTPFRTVQRAVEYLEDNVPCNMTGSILILVTDAEIAHYKAMADGKPAPGWQSINDNSYKRETLIVVNGSCLERRD